MGILRTVNPVLLLKEMTHGLYCLLQLVFYVHLSKESILSCPRLLKDSTASVSGNSPDVICIDCTAHHGLCVTIHKHTTTHLHCPACSHCTIEQSVTGAQDCKLSSFTYVYMYTSHTYIAHTYIAHTYTEKSIPITLKTKSTRNNLLDVFSVWPFKHLLCTSGACTVTACVELHCVHCHSCCTKYNHL